MRGAEGLCSAAANSILTEDNQIWFVHYLSGHYCTKNADIVVKTAYPNENRLSISLCGVKQALQLQREAQKLEKQTRSREQREEEKQRRFTCRQQKRKEKHRGK